MLISKQADDGTLALPPVIDTLSKEAHDGSVALPSLRSTFSEVFEK